MMRKIDYKYFSKAKQIAQVSDFPKVHIGYTNDTEELSGAIADLTKTAKTPGGISLFTDDSKQTYKDTYTLMKDISEAFTVQKAVSHEFDTKLIFNRYKWQI